MRFITTIVIALTISACRCNQQPPKRDSGAPADVAPMDAQLPVIDTIVIPPDGPTHTSGSFAVSVTTVAGQHNCAPGGTGISSMRVGLKDGHDNCVSATLHVKDGPSIVIACPASPMAAPCIEPDHTIIGSDLAPGGYHLTVDGVVGNTVCWRGDASIGVIDGIPSEQGLTLLFQESCAPK